MVCPERDYVRINGKQITLPNESAPAVLRSGHAQWSEWKVYFPVTYLKFPVAYPYGGDPTLGFNEIAIQVNTECQTNGWAVKIDWGSITLRPNLTSPIVFIPGWTGKMDTFQEFAQQASDDGYQAFNIPSDEYLDRGIATPEETAHQVLFLIERALTNTGTKKVFIVAHSRGGIFVRQALREYEALASRIAGYLTISTPHHGVDDAELLGLDKCRDDFLGTGKYWQCVGAAYSLTTTPALTATATAMPTLMPTPTETPTATPIFTATPTFTPTPASPSLLHLSASGSGSVGGVSFAGADILTYDRTTGVWSMVFDGSDVGVTIGVDGSSTSTATARCCSA